MLDKLSDLATDGNGFDVKWKYLLPHTQAILLVRR